MADPMFDADAAVSASLEVNPPKPPTADAFDADAAVAITLGEQKPPSNMRPSVATAIAVDPDMQAEAKRIAASTGVPIDTVLARPDEMKRKAALNGIDFKEYEKAYPASASVLSDVDFAKIAHDDLENMGVMETAFKKAGNVGKSLYLGLGPNFAQSFYGIVETAAGVAAQATDPLSQAVYGLDAEGHTQGPLGLFGSLQRGAGGMRKQAEGVGSYVRGTMGEPGFIEKNIYSGVESTAQMVPMLLASWLTANPSYALGGGSALAGGQAAGKALDKGQTPAQALLYGSEDAAVEWLTEKLPVGKLIGDLKANSPFLKTLWNQAITEVPGEIAATTLQNFNEWANLNPDQPFTDYLAALPKDIAGTVIATLTTVGLSTGVMHGANRVAHGSNKAQAAQQNAEALTQFVAAAEASKVRGRDPASFTQFINKLAEESPTQEFYIDPKALAQSGVNLPEIAAAIPSVAAQLDTAMKTGADIRIPVAEFAAVVPGSTFAQPMIDHVKTEANGMSKVEADEFMKTHGDKLKAEVEKILEEKQGDDVFTTSKQAVQDLVLKQLGEANRFTADVNRPYATLMSNFYAVQAARLGITPEAMFERHPIRIQAEPVTGPTFQQSGPQAAAVLKTAYEQEKVEGAHVVLGSNLGGNNEAEISFLVADKPGQGAGTKAMQRLTQLADKYGVNLVVAPAAKRKKVMGFKVKDKAADARLRGFYNRFGFKDDGGLMRRQASFQHPPGTFAQPPIENPEPHTAQEDMARVTKEARVFSKTITAFTGGRLGGDAVLPMGTPHAVLQAVGVKPHPLVTTRGVLKKILEQKDGTITPEILDKVIESMAHPVAVFKSKTVENSIVVMLDVKDKQGKNINIAIQLDRSNGRQPINLVASIYGRNADRFVTDEVAAGRLLYLDKEKALNWERTTGLQLPKVIHQSAHTRIITNTLDKIKAVEKGQFNQQGANRGAFDPATSTLTLLKAADLSTFLHEAGHFFLETMNKMTLDPNAPPEVKADMDAVLKWFGVKDIATWNSYDIEKQRQHHEKFATSFERYLFEGKAPNVELQGVFQRFGAWLKNVYKSLEDFLRLNPAAGELDPEIRGVFDRMLATGEQIREAEAVRNFEPLFADATKAGMTPEEFKDYHDLALQATQDAGEKLQARSLRDMQWLTNARSKKLRELQREASGKRKAIRAEVEQEVMNEPINLAREYLKDSQAKLDAASVEQILTDIHRSGGELLTLENLESKFGKYGLLRASKGGMAPDHIAEMFGFTSGDHLVRTLLSAEDAQEKIEGITDQRMLERYGELVDPQAIERAADAAIHNDARSRFVATELTALQKATGGQKLLAKAAKQYAEGMIARQKLRDVRPAQYASAEARAARKSTEALKKNDVAAAAVEKRNQLVQNYAARAAYEALEEIDKKVNYLKKFDKKGPRESISQDYVDQIDKLLERYDLRKGVTAKDAAKRASLVDWVASQQALGIEPDIPAELLNEAVRRPYKDLTVEELRGLVDTVKQIEHLGRLKQKLLTAKDQREFNEIVQSMVNSVLLNAGNKPDADNTTRNTLGSRASWFTRNWLAEHRKIASLARELDGFKDGGAMWEYVIRSMNEAGDKEASMRATAAEKLLELVGPMVKREKMGGKGQHFPTVGRSFNREERIGLAFNTGNAGNFQRLLDGEGWTHEQIAPVLDTLTKEDWDFVQSVWDFFEGYRPDIGAKEKRVYGVEPEWVEPVPVNTPHGTYRGGYYPIKYDPRRSAKAEQHNDAEAAKQMMKGAYTSATTRRSFAKSRAEEVKGRPLLYTMDGLFQGVNEVIHDLSWHEWLIDANRLLRNKSLDAVIRQTYGAETVKQFKSAVTDIAAGEMPAIDQLEKGLAHMRTGAVIAGLGFNIMNTVINTAGITQSIVRVGPRWVAQGAGHFAKNPREAVKAMHAESKLMELRAKTMLREVNEVRSVVQDKSAARQAIDGLMFLPLAMTQLVVDTPTWYAAKFKALAEDPDNARAVALADQAVLDAQGGGQLKDLAAIQRGGQIKKLLTTFYGFFSTTYNLSVEATKKTDFKDPMDVLRLAGDYLLLYSIPALFGTLIKAAMTGDDDDLLKKAANDQLSYALSTMVGLRETTGAIQKALGVNQFDLPYGGPAGLRFFQEIDKLGQQAGQGDLDRAFFRSALNVAGIVLHLPSTQINRTIDGLVALADGKTQNPAAIIAGAPKK